ncbi:aminoglycoside phosphotransferase family protein [Micromonospora sp. WMMD1082]|uniref:aminoglycoside phosphotransferase family protein n=1 Tax=Micromonospora sp. WMMD1082 TaxID=3016104 RepID=UPI002416807E|nr:aminoglycoside phosphotransferase family protein [Micromonospora sp. WMMD1082]MDG4795775.1 aminoglycoside phosphotransferase family protein [Micromonospora sp. WMMD1082]
MPSTTEDCAPPAPLDGRSGIDAALVKRLISAQFPQWRDLSVTPVEVDGWDNRTYRLGEGMTVRLPTAPGYVPAVTKENEWLPRLAPELPVAVPPILGLGEPGEGYPFPWSVRGWLPGETADRGRVDDLAHFAVSVAEFLRALHRCDTTGGPLAGEHSFHRGSPPAHYDEETRRFLAALAGHVDVGRAAAAWEAALTAEWRGEPVWFHGDIAVGNLLVADGKLSAVIDFGTSGVGDPACDLVISWTMFAGASRYAFRDAVGQDEGTWARARGWALWKALLVLEQNLGTDPESVAANQRVIAEVLDDHDRLG